MIYGVVDSGERVLPQKNIHAFCPHCKINLIAKCGQIKIHHWAHKEAKGCPYSYGMTYWHYQWLMNFHSLSSDGWEIEYFYDTIRFDAYNPVKKQAIEFQRTIDLEYLEKKIMVCNKSNIKLFWLINPQIFKSFVYTKRYLDSKSDIIFSLRRCKRKIISLLENYIKHPSALFLIDFTQISYLPKYSADRVYYDGFSYRTHEDTENQKYPMKNGIYIIQDLPFMNDEYRRKDSVIDLKFHKSRFTDTEKKT